MSVSVVGVGGSPNSRVAVEWAAGQAHHTGAAVVAVRSLGLLEKMTPELLLGSTGTQVAQHSRRPVTVVPA